MLDAQRALSDKEAELAKLMGELDERSSLADAQKLDIVSLKTQVEALKDRLDAAGNEVKAVEDRRDAERVELKAATQELTEERGKVENLGRRVSELEQQLVAQTTEAEILGRRAQDLETRLGEQSRLLNESEFELKHLRGEIETARKTEGDLRTAIAEIDGRTSSATATLKSEKRPIAVRARSHPRRARPAVSRPRRHEARDRGKLGFRAGGERPAPRAHQRRRRGSGAAGFGAGRPRLADRRHPGGRDCPATAVAAWWPPMARPSLPKHRRLAAILPIVSAPCRPMRRGLRPPTSRKAGTSP
ncbi:MAG: hypothetical protein WDN48_00970 [Pseudolabrys sp.]